jgi:CheY-like chemotaxis protein
MPPTADQKKHILVINDDPAILELFDELLSEEGYSVTLDNFNRPTTELLGVIRDIKPDLVVMDFIIGGELKGWQLVQAAKMDRRVRDIPAIICTAAVKQVTELSEQLDSVGVQVVIKPFDIDVLLDVMDRIWRSQGALVPGPAAEARGKQAVKKS